MSFKQDLTMYAFYFKKLVRERKNAKLILIINTGREPKATGRQKLNAMKPKAFFPGGIFFSLLTFPVMAPLNL